jgi:SAM-dependent methyltransferase
LPSPSPPPTERRAATRAFFGARAAGWEDRFPDDGPRYQQAVGELAPPPGTTVLDVASGTGRAIPYLRAAVGPGGAVVAVDVTWEMLQTARTNGRVPAAALVLGDATALPLPDGSVSSVLAAGYLSHVVDPAAALVELARVTILGGRLAVFHPIGRRALAARHGHDLSDADPMDVRNLEPMLEQCGWHLEQVDDGPDRYLVLATHHGVAPVA